MYKSTQIFAFLGYYCRNLVSNIGTCHMTKVWSSKEFTMRKIALLFGLLHSKFSLSANFSLEVQYKVWM